MMNRAPRRRNHSLPHPESLERRSLLSLTTPVFPSAEIEVVQSPSPQPQEPLPVLAASMSDPKLDGGSLSNVGATWQTVTLEHTYQNPVIAAVPVYDQGSPPLMVRVRHVVGDQFEISVARADHSDAPFDPIEVHYLIAEEGKYSDFEARSVEVSRVDHRLSWRGQPESYLNSYQSPVVIGQVMTSNDPDPSVFWARGDTRREAPSAESLFVGIHVGEDHDRERVPETVGYFVFESGHHEIGSLQLFATVGDPIVEKIDGGPSAYETHLSPGEQSVVATVAGMKGPDGAWALLFGESPVQTDQLLLAVDEDQWHDADTWHVPEEVAVVSFRSIADVPEDPKLTGGIVSRVSTTWTTVTLDDSYENMVLATTPIYGEQSPPLIVRIRNAQDDQFEIAVSRADHLNGPVEPIDVYFLASEAGVFEGFEARKETIDRVDSSKNWEAFRQFTWNSYEDPVVVGQVLTSNDTDPASFWARGDSRSEIPTSDALYVGAHVGEDPDRTRVPEEVGYFVFESGRHTIGELKLLASVGPKLVDEIESGPTYYENLDGPEQTLGAVASIAGFQGGNGGWAVLTGDDSVRDDRLGFGIVEDHWKDDDQAHFGEHVAFVSFAIETTEVPEPEPEPSPPVEGRPSIWGLSEITPRIRVSRVEGYEPLVIQVSAVDTTADGGNPYTDLDFAWDFGDPRGSETFVHPVTGVSVNANGDQHGPEAAYVYRNPGTYTITLTVRGLNEDGELIEAETSTLLRPSEGQLSIEASGGTYTLLASVEDGSPIETRPIPYDADLNTVAAALEALPEIGSGNVRPNPLGRLEFGNELLGVEITLEADGDGLIGSGLTSPSATIEDWIEGSSLTSLSVLEWDGPDVYFDSNDPGTSGIADGSIERPFRTFDQLKAALESNTSQRVLIKRGSVFVSRNEGITIADTNDGPLRIVAYGPPELPPPIVRTEANTLDLLSFRPTDDDSLYDIALDGLDLQSGGGRVIRVVEDAPLERDEDDWFESYLEPSQDSGHQAPIRGEFHLLDSTLSRLRPEHADVPVVEIDLHDDATGDLDRGEGVVFWNVDFNSAEDQSPVQQQGLDLELSRAAAVIGGSFSGGGAASRSRSESDLRVAVLDHLLVRWVDFESDDGTIGAAIEEASGILGEFEGHALFDGLNLGGAETGIRVGDSGLQGPGTHSGTFIIQQSAIHSATGDGIQPLGVLVVGAQAVVVRDSDFWGNDIALAVATASPDLHLGFYRNQLYIPDTPTPSTGLAIWTQLNSAEILESEFMIGGENRGFESIINSRWSGMESWVIDRNHYWAPQIGPDQLFYDPANGGLRSFQEWQQEDWDLEGLYDELDWVDPDQGNFGPSES